MPDAWDPSIYQRFRAERALPFHELLGLVAATPDGRGADLGCGTGELTVHAAKRLGLRSMVGIDSSPAMLTEAAQRSRPPALRFERGDLASWTSDADHDLVLANASLQWVGDHAGVLARWTAALGPGGQLAVQVPANSDHLSHRLAAELAEEPPFADEFLGGVPQDPVACNVLPPEHYAALLHDLEYIEQHVALRVYPHVLPSTNSVVDWVSGTTLTRFRSRLSESAYDRFVAEYGSRLVAALGDQHPYFFGFKRILMWARRPGG